VSDSANTDVIVSQAAEGDSAALATLIDRYRERLKRMVSLRLDRRLQGRVDASDIVQETLIDASRRLTDYARDPRLEFFPWLRSLAAERLIDIHRQHLGAQKRNAAQEVSLYRRPMPEASSVSIARQLLGKMSSPSQAVARAEMQLTVQNVLNSMDPIDREILILRNFEELSTSEAAKELGIKRSTAGKRHLDALRRLKQALIAMPGFDPHAI